jgi:alpha-D-ribose 1-methylphosphonate 5-triphosphate synthase subunit PhnG
VSDKNPSQAFRRQRCALEQALLKLCADFENQTGLVIERLEVEKAHRLAEHGSHVAAVKVEVRL